MTQPCECPGPGFCHRHQLPKDEHLWRLCQTDERYREAFDTYAAMQAQPQVCQDWEHIGETTYRCKRCGAVYGANHESLLPKDRKCVRPQPVATLEVKRCGGCGGNSQAPVETVPLPPKPTLAEKAMSLGKAAVDFVASGFDVTTGDELAARKRACDSCQFRDGLNCRVCGCVLAVKQRERAAHCPMGFWPANEYPWLPSANDEWLKQVMVVIPAYGKVEMTQQAVKDCFREAVHVAVIDNKGDYERVGREHVLRDGVKRNWGESCLFAMHRLLMPDHNSKYLVLLNNDVRLSERFFSGLLTAVGATNAGIVSACYSTGYGEQLHFGGYRGPADGFKPRPFHRDVTRVDGTCVLFSRDCLANIGVFDLSVSPEYGWGLMPDMCIRAKRAGIKTIVTEAAYCEHLDGGCLTAKEFYGNLQSYRHGASREMNAGLTNRWGDWRSLLSAPSIEAKQPRKIATLNLIYHVWPVASNNRWRWNVEQLLKRIGIFNGKKVVAIAEGGGTDPVDEVKVMFAGHDVEFIVKPNSKELREANTFLELLDRVKTDDPTEATFYGHAKGVTRPTMLAEAMWADAMYHACLDNPQRVKDALAEKGMYGLSFEFEQPYIFPGTFWWFHNASLFAKTNWRTLENKFTEEGIGWAVEAFPNRFFADDCERVYLPIVYPRGKSRHLIYSAEFWLAQTPTLEQALSRFDEAHYLASYYDIRREVESGAMDSGKGHYIRHGYDEGREGYSILKYFGAGDLP
ncbi:MAG: glycosyltransferase family 2 protein [Patescibacteria group bacterium]|nr:glycosyltransferase family 2 protein [Patescibacteria group bacterium]